MSLLTTTESTGADHSAPNDASVAARQKAFASEIHTPEAVYNANVPVDAIEPDPKNRDQIDPAEVAKRARSIEEVGLLQPIVLSDLGGGKYRIIAGEHRWRAHVLLKRATIAALIRKGDDALAVVKRKVAENAQRLDLTPIERAKRMRELADLKCSQKEIGALFGGLSQPVVANALRLLELPAVVQTEVAEGRLSEAHGVSLARFAKWPRACACIARMAAEHGYSSKDLNNYPLPFSGQLVQEGLALRIVREAWPWSEEVAYELPKELKGHRDFLVGEREAWYFVPENPADNVWAPEQAKQDAARAVAEEARAKREAAKIAKAGGLTEEQRARRAVLAKNKALRAEIAAGYAAAIEKLKRTPSPTALLIAIIVEAAIAGGFTQARIVAAGEAVGVKLPKELTDSMGQGMREVEAMRRMDVMDLTRVAVAVLLGKQVDEAAKSAWGMPENLEAVMNSKIEDRRSEIGAPKGAAGVEKLLDEVPARAVITDLLRSEVRKYVEDGLTGAEIAKKVKLSLPAVWNIKKALGLTKGRK